jgi:hypothetical protein
MNFRRYALFLLVAILTFVIGVSAAMLFGKVSPFSRRYRMRSRCARLTALPAPKDRFTVYTIYREDGTLVRPYYVDKADGLERLAEPSDEAAAVPAGVKAQALPAKDK